MTESTKNVWKSVGVWCWYVIIPALAFIIIFDQPIFNIFLQYKSLIFISLAAIYNAAMDSVENEHILDTRFCSLKKDFWSKRDSWNKAKRIGGYKLDFWHLAKSCMVVSYVLAVVYYHEMISFWWDIILFGYIYNLTFNAFYNHIFTIKKDV